MHKRNILSFWAVMTLFFPLNIHATELEEVVVRGIDLSERSLFQVALSSVVLVHEYNKEKDQWEYVKSVDASEYESEEETK